MNLEEIKVNEELKKFAEKYNWELEVWHGEYRGVLCGVQNTNPGKNHSHYIDFQTEFL